MAKKKEESKQILERTYNIPLRRETLKAPPYRKAKKAARAVREFLVRHMKSDNVLIGRYLNMKLWEHGMKNPPHHVKVVATKDDKGKVFAELVGAPKEEVKAEEKKTAKKDESKDAAAEKLEETKEEKAEEAKKIEKEEMKELKHEHPKVHPKKEPSKTKFQQQHPTAPKSA